MNEATTHLTGSDFFRIGSYNLIRRLAILFTIVFGILSAIFFPIDTIGFSIYLIVFFLSLGSTFYLHFTKNSKPVFWVFTISASLLVTYSINSILNTLHYSDLMWIVCIVLFAYLGLGYRIAFLFIGFHTLSLLYYFGFSLNMHIRLLEERSPMELFANGLELIFAFFVLSYLIHQNIRFQSYTQNKLAEANRSLATQNTENITLLKEVHHRVKNNLQIVVSLLRMQSSEIESAEARAHFKSAIDRIVTISMIHTRLYRSKELSEIRLKEYLEELIRDLTLLNSDNGKLEIKLNSSIHQLDLKAMVPIGLMINELITNSVKHAFIDSERKTISIAFSQNDQGEILIRYNDFGTWKNESAGGFGLELLNLLAEQIDGKITREGSLIEITFSNNAGNQPSDEVLF